MKMIDRPLEILLIEDNKGDVGLIEEIFNDAEIRINLHIAEDVEEAIRFLFSEDQFIGSPHPDIVILDWNLSKKDGCEVLKEIKENNNLKSIPVITLTTSSVETDIIRAYDLNTNAYIVKPIDFGKFMEVIGSVVDFWLKAVTLPPKKI